MSGSRTKKLRSAFENRTGFLGTQRKTGNYIFHWRQFKKGFKKRGY